jgi:hypothetical protein
MNAPLLILATIAIASLLFSIVWTLAGLWFKSAIPMPDDFQDEEALMRAAKSVRATGFTKKQRASRPQRLPRFAPQTDE